LHEILDTLLLKRTVSNWNNLFLEWLSCQLIIRYFVEFLTPLTSQLVFVWLGLRLNRALSKARWSDETECVSIPTHIIAANNLFTDVFDFSKTLQRVFFPPTTAGKVRQIISSLICENYVEPSWLPNKVFKTVKTLFSWLYGFLNKCMAQDEFSSLFKIFSTYTYS